MVEILEPSGANSKAKNADSFRDLLAASSDQTTKTPIHLRHPDMKGAIVEGLCEVEIDSMPALLEALARSRQRRAQRRQARGNQHRNSNNNNMNAAIKSEATATAVIGTLHYWEHAVSYELNKPSNATVTCVELAAHQTQTPINTTTTTETLESIAHRKSAVSLGQALRQLLLQHAHGTETSLGLSTSELAPVVSYRETTLTRVLQRSMESSKIVLIASISPLSRDYDHTVFTLNYLRRLLVKPGNTLTSPFGGRNNNKNNSNKKATPKTAKTDNRTHQINNNSTSINRSILSSPEAIENHEKLRTMANNPKMLEQLLSDPRQRLARLFGPSPGRTNIKSWSNVLDPMEDGHKSKQGTLTATRLHDPDATSTIGSNSNINTDSRANSYVGPQEEEEEEARQVVESPGSAQQQGQPRQSWQPEDDDDENNPDVGAYEISYENHNNTSNDDGYGDADMDGDEWASEKEIERELLMRGRLKERSLDSSSYNGDDGDDEDYGNNVVDDNYDDYEEVENGEEIENYFDDEAEANEDTGNEVDLQEAQRAYHAPETQDAGDTDGQGSEKIVSEGLRNDDEEEDLYEIRDALEYDMPEESGEKDNLQDQITDGLLDDRAGISNILISNHLEEEFAAIEDDGFEEESDDDGDEYGSLGLQPFTVETVEEEDASHLKADDNRKPHFTDVKWQGEDLTEDLGIQTKYELPDDPFPEIDIVDKINVHSSQLPLPLTPDTTRESPLLASTSHYRESQPSNSYASPYSVTLKTTKSREYMELSSEREELRATVAMLREDLRKGAENHDTNIEEYENKIQQLYAKLDETVEAKRELETVANKSITARTSKEQEVESLSEERDGLLRTVDSLRDELTMVSETHENQLRRRQQEIDDFHSKLNRAMETQKEIEEIADEAVTAHKTQVEETRALDAEREELHATIETMRSTLQSLENDQEDHVSNYHQEIRHLHTKLEETMKDKRSLQEVAADARCQLETQSEKMRLLNLEREELHSILSSIKGSAKKKSGEHDEYLRRCQHEIEQLHTKLDDAHTEKLSVEMTADENRIAKDDLERKVKSLEKELSSSRANTLRLEGIRKEEEDTIRKMNVELRRRDSEKIDNEIFKHELERLKRHKDHLESLVAHRKVESSSALQEIEELHAEANSKNRRLEDEMSSVRMELSLSEKQKAELTEKIRSMSRQLSERDESLERLQTNYGNLESLINTDKGMIAKLREELRNRESETLDIEQLYHKTSRLRQDRDHLQILMESCKNEYERSLEEKANEASIYASQVETLAMDLEKASVIDTNYRTDAEAQLRSFQASEANLLLNLRKRDTEIDMLKDGMATQRDEIVSLREKETCASNAEREVNRLQERLTKLEVTLESTMKEREDAVKKAKNESISYKSTLDDLERTRNEVHRYRNAMKNLNEELDQRQQESLKAKERIFQMESSLRTFKKEAKERVNTLADREKDSIGILERTRHENRDLNSNLKNMNDMVERLRRERDVCFQSLRDGRKKLSELSSRKDSMVDLEDIFSTPLNQGKSPPRKSEPRITSRYSHLPMEAITDRVAPEIFVSGYHPGALGSPTSLAEERAEEIAACVALNAKESLQENLKEVSHLRSQIYRLEDARSDQVASLKSRVRNLENELTDEKVGRRNSAEGDKSEQISSLRAKVRNLEMELIDERVGSRTPVMGSSARRSRKQNNLTEWDQTHWDEKYAY